MSEEELIENCLLFLKCVLTPPRLQHSLGVMKVMGELANIYALDRSQALIAGLVHDAAKDLRIEQQLAIASEARITFTHPCERQPVYLHGMVGAHFVFKELGITDDAILDAVATHTDVGSENKRATLFSQCLRCADILAPVAEWNGMKKFRNVVFAKRIEQALLLRSGWLIEYFHESQIPVHPNLTKDYHVLSDKLKVADSFFERW